MTRYAHDPVGGCKTAGRGEDAGGVAGLARCRGRNVIYSGRFGYQRRSTRVLENLPGVMAAGTT